MQSNVLLCSLLQFVLPVLVGACLMVGGCDSSKLYQPVTSQQASQIQSSTRLDDAVEMLGDYHTPTSVQLEAMELTIQRMPDMIRKNAESDRKVAWGNDSNFIVVVVNEDGIIWATANRHSGSP